MNGVRAAMRGPKFAVVKFAYLRRRVAEGDRVQVSEPIFADIGERIRLKNVMMVGGETFTAIGRPLLKGATVEATVEEHFKSMRMYHFLKTNTADRSGRWVDFEPPNTILRIEKINFEPELKVEGSEEGYTIADADTEGADDAALQALDAKEEAISPVRWSSQPNGPLWDQHERPRISPEVFDYIKWRKLEQIQKLKLYSPGMRYWYWPKDRFTSGVLNRSR